MFFYINGQTKTVHMAIGHDVLHNSVFAPSSLALVHASYELVGPISGYAVWGDQAQLLGDIMVTTVTWFESSGCIPRRT